MTPAEYYRKQARERMFNLIANGVASPYVRGKYQKELRAKRLKRVAAARKAAITRKLNKQCQTTTSTQK